MTSTSADEQHTQAWMNQQPMILRDRYGHGSTKIDDHRIIIVGGWPAYGNKLSSGLIYDARTQQSTPLPNDMPAALAGSCVVVNHEFVYVIGGCDANYDYVNTVYRLCLETFTWVTMAPMGTPRVEFAAVLKDGYIYVFGGIGGFSSTERYSNANNTWEELPDMPTGNRVCHCAVSTKGSEIYIVGGGGTRTVDVFDTSSLSWKNPTYLRNMPEERHSSAAVIVKDKYLVVIGGFDKDLRVTAGCLIYDIWCNRWSSTPASMDMIEAHGYHTAAVLDGKIVVAGGRGRDRKVLASVECIDADALLEYAPLHYPLPTLLFNRILEIGKFESERVDCIVDDEPKA